MKWTNPGHQFDEWGRTLCEINTIYIWGAGVGGANIYHCIHWLGIEKDLTICFVDADKEKQGNLFCDKCIISPQQFFEIFKNDGTMVLIIALRAEKSLAYIYKEWDLENKAEIIPGKNCFTYTQKNKTKKIFSLLMMYRYGKLLSMEQTLITTTECTLNCNCCLNFTPYNKNRRHFPLDELIADIDLLFSRVDYVYSFYISGGESLLYDELPNLIDYIGKKYRNHIYELTLPTNGTLVPGKAVLEKLSEHRLKVRIDDYRDTVPICNEHIPVIIDLFHRYNIAFYLFKPEEWINLEHENTANHFMGNEDLIRHFDACGLRYKYLKNGKLYACDFHAFAAEADVGRVDDGDFLDFKNATKGEILEFLLGYNQKGYISFCKNCLGSYAINKNRIQPAVQLEQRVICDE
ncbi:MAG: radical SAM protein [Defluviitaleaceae bacterium]|nr:radical SAM protein [Defluviitaleaceae bacterium]